jgi:hypothetical protein
MQAAGPPWANRDVIDDGWIDGRDETGEVR